MKRRVQARRLHLERQQPEGSASEAAEGTQRSRNRRDTRA